MEMTDQNQSIQDIMFEFRCLAFFKIMKKRYRYSEIGFKFDDLHNLMKARIPKLVKKHDKDFNEELDIKMMTVKR